MNIFDKLLLLEIVAKETENNFELDEKFDFADLNFMYKCITEKIVLKIIGKLLDDENLYFAITKTTRTQKMVILFNILLGFDMEETAKLIGTTKEAVAKQRQRAILRIKKYI